MIVIDVLRFFPQCRRSHESRSSSMNLDPIPIRLWRVEVEACLLLGDEVEDRPSEVEEGEG